MPRCRRWARMVSGSLMKVAISSRYSPMSDSPRPTRCGRAAGTTPACRSCSAAAPPARTCPRRYQHRHRPNNMHCPIRVLGVRNTWRQPQFPDLSPQPETCPRPALKCGTQDRGHQAIPGRSPAVATLSGQQDFVTIQHRGAFEANLTQHRDRDTLRSGQFLLHRCSLKMLSSGGGRQVG